MSCCARATLGALLLVGGASAASAQTTVTLEQPSTQVVWATVRAGSYANTNIQSALETRASSTPDYLRRTLLKFDTQNTIPAGAQVSSALLTITVKSGSGDTTRRIGAYQVTTSWDTDAVTWNHRKSTTSWTTAGGDLGTQLAVETVSNTAGAKATFDVTALVKKAVSGGLGSSRYTRIALVDLDAATSESYRAYYLPSDAAASNRPTLKVTYGGSSTTTSTSGSTTSTSSSGSTSTSLRVMQWNTHHGGYRTDGVWDPNLLMKWVAKINPDIVSLNEVEYDDSYSHGGDDAALFASILKSLTGKTWYHKFVVGSGASSGIGNAILSKIPFEASESKLLTEGRAILNTTISVNGRTINVFSTHLDANSTTYRLEEISELTAWAGGIAQQRIICGDFNAWPGSTENATMTKSYYDSWAVAKSDGTAISYPANPDGDTRNSRIDYIYYSHGATDLVLKSVQVFDTRDANGVMPSDHRPVLAIFGVK
jgi:endonuclease/exonuclease/phosphatase family metal-dependent hydrolase